VSLHRHAAQTATRASATGSALTPGLVVRSLAPFLSEARKRRIEEVLRGRLVSVTVVLENLYDPHNGAAVLRSCEGFGLTHVHVVEGGEAFSFSRKVSQSAHKWIDVHLHRSFDACADLLTGAGFELWAALPPAHAGVSSGAEVEVDHPAALVFGNEHAGLSAQALARCGRRFSIPLTGFVESLNLSVAAAVALQRTVERRRAILDGRPELPAAYREQLRAGYYALSTPHAAAIVEAELKRII
jgi:tRNA (guanosine-2'-O-)-methyltransferase